MRRYEREKQTYQHVVRDKAGRVIEVRTETLECGSRTTHHYPEVTQDVAQGSLFGEPETRPMATRRVCARCGAVEASSKPKAKAGKTENLA